MKREKNISFMQTVQYFHLITERDSKNQWYSKAVDVKCEINGNGGRGNAEKQMYSAK